MMIAYNNFSFKLLKKFDQKPFFQKENLTKEILFLLAQVFFLEKRKSVE